MRRYITNFRLNSIRKEYCDVLIIGTGIAGLYTSLNIDSNYKVVVLSKDKISENNSNLAQGGIAACFSEDDDINLHFEDTIKAGNYYNDKKAVKILVQEASENIKKLIKIGTNFDKDKDGNIRVTKEGGHSKRRILHSKDETGKEIIRALSEEALKRENINIIENIFAIDLLTVDDKCLGVLVKNEEEIYAILSKATVLATGGIGQVYDNTTNSIIATGDGIAMAYRAGVEIVDMEFVQFHPTALYNESDSKRFLISEAVRGEGAVLRNSKREAFMEKYHELKDLAPRDIVAKSIFNEMLKEDKPCVYLDITHKNEDFIKSRFPNIYKMCLSRNIDMTKDYIPVCPVQHYIMGGVKIDYFGRTNIQRLYACGETSCVRVHGANRLASNSLLEGLVFGNRIANDINKIIERIEIENYLIENEENYKRIDKKQIQEIKVKVKKIMGRYAFILRSKEGLNKALNMIEEILNKLDGCKEDSKEFYECFNIATVAYLIVKAALNREKSLGSHIIVDSLEEFKDA
ncbi:L-aspartate oxidase [Caminicella sporogenes DSM 14501]|uniref:L-aspartate oxidase n=1 Tax=Caminicella sporogenes DSM 14501 TaxID=1121266 RepID=A0A1M6S8Q7_9FIRM|nr:L-aspartate oxidase [Caminicella sporogenes]RKD26915.1 L-aspartate oxidase [Caminicella sporogenes]SHK41113.1 L-aspartate oxidase [Caminicella sporogenes DSM 14501]